MMIGPENCLSEVYGPEAELEKLKEPFKNFAIQYYVLDQGSRTFFKAVDQVEAEDKHVTIVPYFTVIISYSYIYSWDQKSRNAYIIDN